MGRCHCSTGRKLRGCAIGVRRVIIVRSVMLSAASTRGIALGVCSNAMRQSCGTCGANGPRRRPTRLPEVIRLDRRARAGPPDRRRHHTRRLRGSRPRGRGRSRLRAREPQPRKRRLRGVRLRGVRPGVRLRGCQVWSRVGGVRLRRVQPWVRLGPLRSTRRVHWHRLRCACRNPQARCPTRGARDIPATRRWWWAKRGVAERRPRDPAPGAPPVPVAAAGKTFMNALGNR